MKELKQDTESRIEFAMFILDDDLKRDISDFEKEKQNLIDAISGITINENLSEYLLSWSNRIRRTEIQYREHKTMKDTLESLIVK